jgi:nucleotide-binding universal stress UspA family protein
MILISYDGSADARAAIDHAGDLFGDQPVTVLTVWRPMVLVMTRSGAGLGMGIGVLDYEEIDAASERGALARAEEGAERARSVGLNAQARSRVQRTTVADAIIDEASDCGASAIVVGSRGLAGVKSVLLGSVSSVVLHHSDVPVLGVTSPEVAELRGRREARAAARV